MYLRKVVKYGNFTLKSGVKSDVYVDFRSIISDPDYMEYLVDDIWYKLKIDTRAYICGVPEACVPLASYISFKYKIPQILLRKTQKDHGTKNIIEGTFKKGEGCILIEDVVSTGSSIKESIEKITSTRLTVKKIYV